MREDKLELQLQHGSSEYISTFFSDSISAQRRCISGFLSWSRLVTLRGVSSRWTRVRHVLVKPAAWSSFLGRRVGDLCDPTWRRTPHSETLGLYLSQFVLPSSTKSFIKVMACSRWAGYPARRKYGRATVALTRVRSLCIILEVLDMKELLGTAVYWFACVWSRLRVRPTSICAMTLLEISLWHWIWPSCQIGASVFCHNVSSVARIQRGESFWSLKSSRWPLQEVFGILRCKLGESDFLKRMRVSCLSSSGSGAYSWVFIGALLG